jgi:hypothetical protein
MDAQTYAGVSEAEFAAFVTKYRKLNTATPFVVASLCADTCGKGVLLSYAFDATLEIPSPSDDSLRTNFV